jgi:hypothetical protein
MYRLFVPIGISELGEFISPQFAKKGDKYYCPSCKSELILKQGIKRIYHFAHKIDCDCKGETNIHFTAKFKIMEIITNWNKGLIEAPRIERTCNSCLTVKKLQSVPEKVKSAVMEYRIKDIICDVVLFGSEGEPLVGIEIRVTHLVDEIKTKKYPIPFIELDGIEIVEHPNLWRPLKDTLNTYLCNGCAKEKKKLKEKIFGFTIYKIEESIKKIIDMNFPEL